MTYPISRPNVEAFFASNLGKVIAAMVLLAMMIGASAHAGTSDNLGIKGTYDIIVGWFTDAYVSRTVAIVLFVIGVTRAVQGAFLQFFIMLGFAILISQGQTIIEKIFTGTLPM